MKASLLLITLVLAGSSTPAQPYAGKMKNEPRLMQLRVVGPPISRNGVPLSNALSEVGRYVDGGYVLFGIELLLDRGKEPTVDLKLQSGATLEEALRHVVQQLPEYRFQVVGPNLVNVFPRKWQTDPRNPLNLKVSRFDVTDVPPANILSRPEEYVPELQARLRQPDSKGYFGRGISSLGPRNITLHLKNVTVRQVLNAVSVASGSKSHATHGPLGWVYRFDPNSGSPDRMHSWDFHFSTPPKWRQEHETSNRNK
ncbi:MAG TPA: hypothetical protein VGQ71_07760 [Terriglobales bacterium]|jgi:hypothetical protein|nr:hypothetical protein [Terriglobales bacterium]